MESAFLEASYPLTFRHHDVAALEESLRMHNSIELVGMKRVGINNFLRFFLAHKNIPQDAEHVFILVDLTGLIERELFPFWRLLFKRVADIVQNIDMNKQSKVKIASLFDAAIQSGDVFLTYDSLRETIAILSRAGIAPVIILNRFDRLKDVITHEFFDNLQGLKDVAGERLSYVFTSYRQLEMFAPEVFKNKSVAMFSQVQYVKPALAKDMEYILGSFEERYRIKIHSSLKQSIISFSGGHVQYAHLLLIIYLELNKQGEIFPDAFKKAAETDERIILQSEELWDSLIKEEQRILKKILAKEIYTNDEKKRAIYLWNTGFVMEKEKTTRVFSDVFSTYIEKMTQKVSRNGEIELTKKEKILFSLLEKKKDAICEREEIIEIVWPEYTEYGVSDWSIDKLVARLRDKLEKRQSEFEIVTIRTRGYKLQKKE